ncbi:hypothetical protein ACP70R_020004 [Stipagrostis hirtigluma subsp. patula]
MASRRVASASASAASATSSTGAAPPPATAAATARRTARRKDASVADVVIKSSNDIRGFRHVVLTNELRCLLISDPHTEKAAAGMCLPVGHFHDPDGLEGLSQLLVNSILDGHGEDAFRKYICEHDGSAKGVTYLERMYLSFEGDESILNPALDRFVKLFLEPPTAPYAGAGRSGCVEKKECDILHQLHHHHASKGHPYYKFRPDNWQQAEFNAKKFGKDIVEELKTFYDKFFSANLMFLIVYSRGGLDELQGTVETRFSTIRNSNRNGAELPRLPSGNIHSKFFQVVPVEAHHILRFYWPVTRNIKNNEVGALKYLIHVFGFEQEGSLFYNLKKLGWIMHGDATERDCNSNFSFFCLSLDLTDEGLEHYEDIVGIVFYYIKSLRKWGPRKYIFEELQDIAKRQFEDETVSLPLMQVDHICSNIMVFPVTKCLIGSSAPSIYPAKKIRDILNVLTAERVRFFLASKIFEGQTDLMEPVCGTPYRAETVMIDSIQKWTSKIPKLKMHLPGPNTLLKPVKGKDTIPCPRQMAATKKSEHKSGDVIEMVSTRRQLQRIVGKEPNPGQASTSLSAEGLVQLKDRVCIIYDDRMLSHKPRRTHPENPERIRAIYDQLQSDGLFERCAVYKSEKAKLKDVLRVHDGAYVLRILGEKKLHPDAIKDMYLNDSSPDCILLSAGAAIKACRLVAEGQHKHAFAVVRPPGHHAKKEREAGFCFLNNVAIAAKYLKKRHNKKKLLILDWDIHQGNGTSEIFYGKDDVLFISLHREPFFPYEDTAGATNMGEGKGKGFTCNFCWTERRIQDGDFYAAMDYVVVPLVLQYNPDLILISGGFDAALGDKLGDCKLTHRGYATALHKLFQLNKGMVIVLEGGYTMKSLGQCVSSCIKVLCGESSEVDDTEKYCALQSTWEAVLKVRGLLKEQWSILSSDIPVDIPARTRIKDPDKD